MKLKVGDEVQVTAGKDKGRKGKIDRVYPAFSLVRVTGLNVYKKSVKARTGGEKGGMVEFSRPLPLASVALVCPNCGKPTRVGIRVNKTGDKTRTCLKCGRAIIASRKAGSASGRKEKA